MSVIHGTIRNGRIETSGSLPFPEGSALTIALANGSPIPECEAQWQDTPAAIESWLRWYDSLEPLEFTDAERAERDADRSRRKLWEKEHFAERAERLERQWP